MKLNKDQIRQGDVLLSKVDALPAGAIEVPMDGSRIVLAYGEVTGHAHAIYETKTKDGAPTAKLWSAGAERFLQVLLADLPLKHEEHSHPFLCPGVYKLPAQMEYDRNSELRRVQD